jgi:hypothetical protein
MRAANRHHQTLIPLMSGGNQGLVRNGLVAEYRFDEKGGQTLIDHSGLGNHGTLGSTTGADTNDPTYTGEGALCTTDDYFVIPNVFAGLTGCTVMIVANTTVQADFGGIIAGGGASAASHSMNIREDLAASNKVYVQVSDGTSTTVCNLPTALTSALECITARFTGGSNIAARHNLGAWSSATTTITALNPDTTKAHYISRYAGAYFRTGSTCYCVVYNRALTDAEIGQNYNYLKSYLLRERGITLA